MQPPWQHANNDFDEHARLTLIDWLSEVCATLHLSRRTFHLTVGLFDFLLRQGGVTGQNAQSAAVAALQVATSHCDIGGVSHQELIFLTDKGVTILSAREWMQVLLKEWRLPAVRTILDELPQYDVVHCNYATALVLAGFTAWYSAAECAQLKECTEPHLKKRWELVHSAVVDLEKVATPNATTRKLSMHRARTWHVHFNLLDYMYR